jgi:pyruvate/2-oxoglutarate/acetoin dehydrogenase E1 component
MPEELTFAEAIRDATELALDRDPNVYVIGLGVPDPKAVFGTTAGLQERFGPGRVMDMPAAENGMTGVAIGTAIAGMRPVMVHQRFDFALLAVEQLVNQAAKWHYTFDGQMRVPLVVRMLVGRGWGQGPQHSQSLHSWFAHIPGLNVVLPSSPADAKGLLLTAIEDDNPVIFIEHRWLYNLSGPVPDGYYTIPFGEARVVQEGTDVTIVATSYMVPEALAAANALAAHGVSAEVIDPRTLRPLDTDTIIASVRKTGRLMVVDTSWKTFGFTGEIVAAVAEEALDALVAPPKRISMPEVPVPTARALARFSYPRARDLVLAAAELVGSDSAHAAADSLVDPEHLDIPDPSFTGPF